MVYMSSIPIIKPNIHTHQYSEGGLSTLTNSGNINPTAYAPRANPARKPEGFLPRVPSKGSVRVYKA